MHKFLPVGEFAEIFVFGDKDSAILIGKFENHIVGYPRGILSDGNYAIPRVSETDDHTPAYILIREKFHAASSGIG